MQQYIVKGEKHILKTQGVCSKEVRVVVEGNIVQEVEFIGGCDGNLKGVCKLAAGRTVEEVHDLLKGIRCGYKSTSCPDQLSKLLEIVAHEKDKLAANA